MDDINGDTYYIGPFESYYCSNLLEYLANKDKKIKVKK